MPRLRFIQLNRTFHELADYTGQTDEIDLSQVIRSGKQFDWAGILKFSRTVILSEAGSGKTQELKHIASKLTTEGKPAFFLRLELILSDLDIAFEVGTKVEFEAWKNSNNEGWLLLDSVDEARLKSPQDFEIAIRKLGKLIDGAKERVTIVLTGRTHAWRPKTDLELCEKYIGAPPKTINLAPETVEESTNEDGGESEVIDELLDIYEDQTGEPELASPGLKVVALDDLSRKQVTLFASESGVKDIAAFEAAIERADAWSSTTRPQDLEEIVALWLQNEHIGTRLEIMQSSVSRRLAERDQQRAEAQPISDSRVYDGAMLLAAGTTMCQTQTIRVPDGAHNNQGITAKSILTDWTDTELSTLLARPIFDDAIYGTVRFHHRSVREFLSARWLLHLLEKPVSRRSIDAILFRKQYGLEVVIPTTRPLLPWLAIYDEKIRERIRKIAPEVIFEGGDPAALPLTTRRQILFEVCDRLSNNQTFHSATAYDSVQRFAQPDIADDIRTLLKQHGSNDEVVGFLMRMIWLGQINSLAAEAKLVALSPHSSQYTRITAFRAVREVCDAQDQQGVRNSFIAESPSLDRDWIGELATDLEPSDDSVRWLVEAIGKSADKKRYSVDRLSEAVEVFADATPSFLLPSLLTKLLQLLGQPPFIEQRYCEVSERFSWLLNSIIDPIERLAKSRDAFALSPIALEILHKFAVSRHWRKEDREKRTEFSKVLQSWQPLNDASFWHDIEATRTLLAGTNEELTSFWQAQAFGAFWTFGVNDFDRVCSWIGTQSIPDNNSVALTLAFWIFTQNGKPNAWLSTLRTKCAATSDLEARLQYLLSPTPENKKFKEQERRWKRRAAKRTKK